MNATDFNDLAAMASIEEVQRQVEQAVPAIEPPSWPDPILPGTLRTQQIPPEVLPSWLADMARAVSESTQTPPALAVMSALAVLATVLHRRF